MELNSSVNLSKEMDMGKVVEFKEKQFEGRTIAVKEPEHTCGHKAISVDKYERTITCRVCGAVVEPFDFILRLGYEERSQKWQFDEIAQEVKKLREQRETLLREVNNLKGQKRRLDTK